VLGALVGLGAAMVVVPTSGATGAHRRSTAMADSSTAHIYWSEPENGYFYTGIGINTIWRAGVTGTNVDRSFVNAPQYPGPVAVSGSYLYWGDQMATAIGRVKLDGTGVNQNFIDAAASALAVTGHYIFWISGTSPGELWRASLDGSHIRLLAKLSDGGYFGGIAVDSSHVYWSNRDQGAIGRAALDGTHLDRHFITGLKEPNGLAVSGTTLFWASTNPNTKSSSIGRANLNGTSVTQNFITGAAYPFGVAAGGNHLYWTNFDTGMIGRANLDGTHVHQRFINAKVPNRYADPFYLAVGP
jgi:sugar lactone lactonase YvrE